MGEVVSALVLSFDKIDTTCIFFSLFSICLNEGFVVSLVAIYAKGTFTLAEKTSTVRQTDNVTMVFLFPYTPLTSERTD